MAKKSFVLHKDSLEILEELNNEQAGILFKAIANYNSDKDLPEMDFAIKIAFIPFKNQFERDNEAYEKKCKINRENGNKGGRPQEKPKRNPIKPTESEKTQSVIPEYSEFMEYALSKAKDIDLEKLQIKYEAWKENGWKDGHNKAIKNWKSKLLQTLQYLKNGNSKSTSGNQGQRTSASYDRSEAISEASTLFNQPHREQED